MLSSPIAQAAPLFSFLARRRAVAPVLPAGPRGPLAGRRHLVPASSPDLGDAERRTPPVGIAVLASARVRQDAVAASFGHVLPERRPARPGVRRPLVGPAAQRGRPARPDRIAPRATAVRALARWATPRACARIVPSRRSTPAGRQIVVAYAAGLTWLRVTTTPPRTGARTAGSRDSSGSGQRRHGLPAVGSRSARAHAPRAHAGSRPRPRHRPAALGVAPHRSRAPGRRPSPRRPGQRSVKARTAALGLGAGTLGVALGAVLSIAAQRAEPVHDGTARVALRAADVAEAASTSDRAARRSRSQATCHPGTFLAWIPGAMPAGFQQRGRRPSWDAARRGSRERHDVDVALVRRERRARRPPDASRMRFPWTPPPSRPRTSHRSCRPADRSVVR